MRYIVDECTGHRVAIWLRSEGHDVFSVYESARGWDDNAILQKSVLENRILITNDKDFGDKVYRDQMPHKGIILLRLEDDRVINRIAILKKVIRFYEERLINHFIVVTEKRIRIRS